MADKKDTPDKLMPCGMCGHKISWHAPTCPGCGCAQPYYSGHEYPYLSEGSKIAFGGMAGLCVIVLTQLLQVNERGVLLNASVYVFAASLPGLVFAFALVGGQQHRTKTAVKDAIEGVGFLSAFAGIVGMGLVIAHLSVIASFIFGGLCLVAIAVMAMSPADPR
jgi:hypothetical protein